MLQSLPQPEYIRIVHIKHTGRNSSDGAQRQNRCAAPPEMVVPYIRSRVKQSRQFSRLRVDPRNIRALEAIAVNTREGQIVQIIRASMLSGNDVIGLKRRWMPHSQ